MKIMDDDDTFGYSSAYWTNKELLNSESSIEEEVNAKYEFFNHFSFRTLKICVGGPNENCFEHVLEYAHQSALSLFKSTYMRDGSINQASLLQK